MNGNVGKVVAVFSTLAVAITAATTTAHTRTFVPWYDFTEEPNYKTRTGCDEIVWNSLTTYCDVIIPNYLMCASCLRNIKNNEFVPQYFACSGLGWAEGVDILCHKTYPNSKTWDSMVTSTPYTISAPTTHTTTPTAMTTTTTTDALITTTTNPSSTSAPGGAGAGADADDDAPSVPMLGPTTQYFFWRICVVVGSLIFGFLVGTKGIKMRKKRRKMPSSSQIALHVEEKMTGFGSSSNDGDDDRLLLFTPEIYDFTKGSAASNSVGMFGPMPATVLPTFNYAMTAANIHNLEGLSTSCSGRSDGSHSPDHSALLDEDDDVSLLSYANPIFSGNTTFGANGVFPTEASFSAASTNGRSSSGEGSSGEGSSSECGSMIRTTFIGDHSSNGGCSVADTAFPSSYAPDSNNVAPMPCVDVNNLFSQSSGPVFHPQFNGVGFLSANHAPACIAKQQPLDESMLAFNFVEISESPRELAAAVGPVSPEIHPAIKIEQDSRTKSPAAADSAMFSDRILLLKRGDRNAYTALHNFSKAEKGRLVIASRQYQSKVIMQKRRAIIKSAKEAQKAAAEEQARKGAA